VQSLLLLLLLLASTHFASSKISIVIIIDSMKMDTKWQVPTIQYNRLNPTFGSFYVIRIGFTLRELVSLVKAFRLLELEWILCLFVGVQSVDIVGRCTTILLFIGQG
jgi:hypothetical protein